jgi:hypothetical protein
LIEVVGGPASSVSEICFVAMASLLSKTIDAWALITVPVVSDGLGRMV